MSVDKHNHADPGCKYAIADAALRDCMEWAGFDPQEEGAIRKYFEALADKHLAIFPEA